MNAESQQSEGDLKESRLKAVLRKTSVCVGDIIRILANEFGAFAVQIAIVAAALLCIAGAPERDESGQIVETVKAVHFDTTFGHMIGDPLGGAEDEGSSDSEHRTSATGRDLYSVEALLSPAVWRNRLVFILPYLGQTTILIFSGALGAAVVASLLVVPALQARSPGVKAAFAVLDEFGLLLCCVPVFVAGFLIRLKVPQENIFFYYLLAALSLGIGNLTLAEMVQMLRGRMNEEIRRPYFDLINARGFSLLQRWKHRILPYSRALILSVRSKIPILFSSVVIIEIILSQEEGGRQAIKRGLGLLAKQAADSGDGITLFWIILAIALWIRALSFVAETVTYFWLWNPKQQ